MDGEFTMGCEDGGSSSSIGGAGSAVVLRERKSCVDPITGVEILRWEMVDEGGKISLRFAVLAREGRVGETRVGEEPLL